MSDRLTPKDVDVLMSDVEELRNAQYNQGKADERREIIKMLRAATIPDTQGNWTMGFNGGLEMARKLIKQRSQGEK